MSKYNKEQVREWRWWGMEMVRRFYYHHALYDQIADDLIEIGHNDYKLLCYLRNLQSQLDKSIIVLESEVKRNERRRNASPRTTKNKSSK